MPEDCLKSCISLPKTEDNKLTMQHGFKYTYTVYQKLLFDSFEKTIDNACMHVLVMLCTNVSGTRNIF